MKKISFFILTTLFLVPLSSFAFQSQARQTLNVTDALPEDYYAVAGTININSPAAKDLTLFGGKNFINGSVGQDLMMIGGDIIINSSVGESAKIAGGTVNINSAVQKDLFIGGAQVTLGANTFVQGDTLIGASLLEMNGTLNNANLNADQLNLNGTINGNAVIRAAHILVFSGAKIIGNLNYRSTQQNTELERIVSGKVTFTKIYPEKGMRIFGGLLGTYLTFGFFFLLGFGLLFFYIGKNWFTAAIVQLKVKPWYSLLYGFLVYLIVPVAAMILFMSMIGIPFGFLFLAVWVFLFVFYKLFNVVFYAHFLVERLGGIKKVKIWKQILIILACTLVSSIIATVDIVFTFFALGAMIRTHCLKDGK